MSNITIFTYKMSSRKMDVLYVTLNITDTTTKTKIGKKIYG